MAIQMQQQELTYLLCKCKIEGLMDNTNRFIIAKLLQGFKRLRNRVDGRLPLTEHMLA